MRLEYKILKKVALERVITFSDGLSAFRMSV